MGKVNEETTMQVVEDNGIDIVDERRVELSRTYIFDGVQYSELDLSGIDCLTARDMIDVEKRLNREGNTSLVPEMTMDYALAIASKATNIPVEFFYELRPRDTLKIKNRVLGFFYGAD